MGKVGVTLDNLFHTLLTLVSNDPVQVPKCVIVAHVTDIPTLVFANEAALLKTHFEKLGGIH